MNTRFAPSPTGKLHAGNIRIAILNYNAAKLYNQKFILRIDDTDIKRSNSQIIQDIQNLLLKLGIPFDYMYQQSKKDYTQHIQKLKDLGFLYPCYETEEELNQQRIIQNKQGLPPRYIPSAINITKEPHWRFKLDRNHIETWNDKIFGPQKHKLSEASDPVVIRQDGTLLYILASIIDDIDDKISIIVRGADHIANSAIQRYMWRSLGYDPDQITFAHIPLMLDTNGKPFSKRNDTDSIEQFLSNAYFPHIICHSLLIPGYSGISTKWQEFDPFSYSKCNTKWEGCSKLQKKYLLKLNASDGQKWLNNHGWLNATSDHWEYLKHEIISLTDIIKWKDIMENSEIIFPSRDELDIKIKQLQEIDPYKISDILNISIRLAANKLRYILCGSESGPSIETFKLLNSQIIKNRMT